MKRRLAKAQEGMQAPQQGGGGQEAQQALQGIQQALSQGTPVEQLFPQVLQLTGGDPQAAGQMLVQAGAPQEEVMQVMQQAQGGGQDPNGQEQPQMKGGGITTNPFQNPKEDFNEIRKNLVKMYKKGGDVKESEMDTSSTQGYVNSLKEVFERKMFTGHALGAMKNRGMEAPQFVKHPQEVNVPMAKNGIVVDENGVPSFDVTGNEIHPYLVESFGVNSMADFNALPETERAGMVEGLNKHIIDNSKFGAHLRRLGMTPEDLINNPGKIGHFNFLAEESEDFYDTPEVKDFVAPEIVAPASTSNSDGTDGYTQATVPENPPVVLTPEEEAAKAAEEAVENPYEKGLTYEWDGEKMVTVQKENETSVGGDESKGQAHKSGRTYKGHNAESGNQFGMSSGRTHNTDFLNAMANILDRRQVGVQGNMSPEEFEQLYGQAGISEVNYKNRRGLFGGKEKFNIKFGERNVGTTPNQGDMKTYQDGNGNPLLLSQEEADAMGFTNGTQPAGGNSNWLDDRRDLQTGFESRGMNPRRAERKARRQVPHAEYGMDTGFEQVAKFKPLYEYDVDFGAAADVLYEGGSRVNEFLEAINAGPSSSEEERSMRSVDRQFVTAPTKSGLRGHYDKQTGAAWSDIGSRGRLAGRSGDYIEGEEGQKFTRDFAGRGSNRLAYGLKDGGLVMAKAGMQVGDELELSPEELDMMKKLGYTVTQIQ